MNQSMDISQSSQLTNDQNDTQPLISSTTNEKITTPARISYLTNPDGSRISISRPPLSTNHQSPLTSLRRVRNQFFALIFLIFFPFHRHQRM
jgi:type IV secretory pathway ATPase VirB11/archaellum biosynthesis ATPase